MSTKDKLYAITRKDGRAEVISHREFQFGFIFIIVCSIVIGFVIGYIVCKFL